MFAMVRVLFLLKRATSSRDGTEESAAARLKISDATKKGDNLDNILI